MTIVELADIMQTVVNTTKKLDGTYTCSILELEIKEDRHGGVLGSPLGRGKTKIQAINDYIKRIKGKWGVVEAFTGQRREYPLPKNITRK